MGQECDAQICYKFPGVANRKGVMKKPYYSIKSKFMTMEVASEGDKGPPKAYEVKYDLDVSLEKVVFCEKFSPPQKLDDGNLIHRKCTAQKRCGVKGAKMTACLDYDLQERHRKSSRPWAFSLEGLTSSNAPRLSRRRSSSQRR